MGFTHYYKIRVYVDDGMSRYELVNMYLPTMKKRQNRGF